MAAPGPLDFHRQTLLRRSKASLVDQLLNALQLNSDEAESLRAELPRLRMENAELKDTLRQREEAARFVPEALDGSDDRTLRALSVALLHGRDGVIADLNDRIAQQQKTIDMLKKGGGRICDVQMEKFAGSEDIYGAMARKILRNPLTVSEYITKLSRDVAALSETIVGY